MLLGSAGFPDGFIVVLVFGEPAVLPLVVPVDVPVVVPVAALPGGGAAPAPVAPPLVWASANVPESANAAVNAKVVIFIVVSCS